MNNNYIVLLWLLPPPQALSVLIHASYQHRKLNWLVSF